MKKKKVIFICVFAAIIFAVPVYDLSNGGLPALEQFIRQFPKHAAMKAFQNEVETNSCLANQIRPWMQFGRFLILKDYGDKALANNNGWFFYKPAFRYLTESWSPSTDTSADDVLDAVVSYRDELAKRDIHLLVIIAPNKSSIYPEKLAKRCRVQQVINKNTVDLIHNLNASGIHMIDLFEVYLQAKSSQKNENHSYYYSPQDSHWSPEGIKLAAKATAKKLHELGWIEDGSADYSLEEVCFNRRGDIPRMIRVPRIENLITPELTRCNQVLQPHTGDRYKDDPASPLLIIGDSFLRIYQHDEPKSAGFIANLAYELRMSIASIVSDGGASTLVRQQLYGKPQMLKNKKVVIWEFVERDIRFGTEGWQIVPLPQILSSD